MTDKKLVSVQALRGIAALLVLIFHIDAMFHEGAPRSRDFGDFWARGFAGVDMFFVISGFIMVWVTQETELKVRSSWHFLYARLTRIYPTWWIFAFLMMGYFYFSYGQPAAPDKVSGDDILPYTIKSLLLLPQNYDPVLGVGWTLVHEMQFYILFATFLLAPRKFLPVFLGMWASIIVLVNLVQGTFVGHAKNNWELFTSPLNIEFIFGAYAALWPRPQRFRNIVYIFCAGILFFFLATLFQFPLSNEYFNWVRVAIFGVPSALLIIGAVHLECQGKLWVPKPLIILGDWSYSLYLSHILILLTIKRLWNKGIIHDALPAPLKWGAEGWLDNVLYIALALSASIIFACISYHVIEKTSLKLLRRKVTTD